MRLLCLLFGHRWHRVAVFTTYGGWAKLRRCSYCGKHKVVQS